MGTYYFNKANGYGRFAITDAQGDRFTFGAPGKGDFYKIAEFGYKLFPVTDNAGYSKLGLWHNDGGKTINGMTGEDGWGWYVLAEQELSADGNVVGVARWGQSEDGAAIYDRQGALAVLFYEPFGWFKSDAIGVQGNYIESVVADTPTEKSLELFYRFPLLPELETTVAYQYVDSPALAQTVDEANVFSIRFTTSF